jgi:hypothetical protein
MTEICYGEKEIIRGRRDAGGSIKRQIDHGDANGHGTCHCIQFLKSIDQDAELKRDTLTEEEDEICYGKLLEITASEVLLCPSQRRLGNKVFQTIITVS